MDVGGWLRNLGLGQYELAFIENAIGADILPELTEGDLEKLGVPLGDRKRLIKAIKALAGWTLAAGCETWDSDSMSRHSSRTLSTPMCCRS